jgi:hypothetical protein
MPCHSVGAANVVGDANKAIILLWIYMVLPTKLPQPPADIRTCHNEPSGYNMHCLLTATLRLCGLSAKHNQIIMSTER